MWTGISQNACDLLRKQTSALSMRSGSCLERRRLELQTRHYYQCYQERRKVAIREKKSRATAETLLSMLGSLAISIRGHLVAIFKSFQTILESYWTPSCGYLGVISNHLGTISDASWGIMAASNMNFCHEILVKGVGNKFPEIGIIADESPLKESSKASLRQS